MKYNNIIDMHTHSDHSFDGNHSCIYMCEKAIENGVIGLAITDHCEIDSKNFDFRAFCLNQFVDTLKVKKLFEKDLNIMQGLEIGQAIYNSELADDILKQYDYDFVIASLHNFDGEKDFYYIDYHDIDVTQLMLRYFDNIIQLCRWGNFDALAHLTYPFRYISEQLNVKFQINTYKDKIEEILSILIQNDKALEINTSGLSMAIGDTLPNTEVVSLFKKMGGKYVTVGSDAHYADKIGQGIAEGMGIAYDSGFRNITVYKKHKPQLIKIE